MYPVSSPCPISSPSIPSVRLLPKSRSETKKKKDINTPTQPLQSNHSILSVHSEKRTRSYVYNPPSDPSANYKNPSKPSPSSKMKLSGTCTLAALMLLSTQVAAQIETCYIGSKAGRDCNTAACRSGGGTCTLNTNKQCVQGGAWANVVECRTNCRCGKAV